MTLIKTIRAAVLVVVLTAMASPLARAQYADYESPRWHINGIAGFDMTHTSQSVTGQQTQENQLFPVGDLRLNSDGFLLDPKFLHISAGFDYQKGANTSERGDLSTGGLNLAMGTVFLPRSHAPLRVNYVKTSHGIQGLDLNQNDDDSRLDVQWSMLFPSLPQLNVSFQKYGNTVHVPTSFGDHNYDELAFNLGINDLWKGWQWAGNFSTGSASATGVSQIGLNNPFDDTTRTGSFNVNRNFWENKARLTFDNRELWRTDHIGGDGTSESVELTDYLNFSMQLNPRVTVDTGYGFSHVDFRGGFDNLVAQGGGQIQTISLSVSTSHSVSGRISYHPQDWLRLTQEIRTVHASPIAGVLESRTSFTESASTISADHRWHGFDMTGSYTGRFQITGTTLDNTPDSWSNSFTARVGWGDARLVRLTGTVQDVAMNLVEQIGGFSHEKRLGAEAETHRVKSFRFRFAADYSEVELLNVSGDTRSKITSYGLQADHRLFSAGFTRSFTDGAGALFPLDLIDRQFLVVPLPIGQLVATPLLNRTTHSDVVTVTARPRRRLDVQVSWHAEDTRLENSDQTFDVLQADARYRLGKFSVEGGYSKNINNVTIITGLTGNRLAMWYLRIGRDFRIF